MTDNEQLLDIKSRSNAFAIITTRQVLGGLVVSAQVQYADKDTGGILATQSFEGVATTPEQASNMHLNFLRTGSFEAPAQKLQDAFAMQGTPVVPQQI